MTTAGDDIVERDIDPPIDAGFLDELVDRLQVWSGACLSPEDAAATGPLITALLRNAAYAIERLRAALAAAGPGREEWLEKTLLHFMRCLRNDLYTDATVPAERRSNLEALLADCERAIASQPAKPVPVANGEKK